MTIKQSSSFSTRRAALLSGLMAAGAVAAPLLRPTLASVAAAPSLNDFVPSQFGNWRAVASNLVQVGLTTATEPNMDQPYDQVVMRRYLGSKGGVVLLAIAWGGNQRQEVKIHRPELCYGAQGFEVRSLLPTQFGLTPSTSGPVLGKRMVAFNGNRGEAVAYWIRIGRIYSENAVDTRLHILREGLAGHTTDGVLVRASVPIADVREAEPAFRLAEGFLAELIAATPPAVRDLLVR